MNAIVSSQETAQQKEITNININTGVIKRITIDDNPNKYVDINTSDMNTFVRLSEIRPKLEELDREKEEILKESSSKKFDNVFDELDFYAGKLREIDSKMREYVDCIFNAKISDVCADIGNMYDILPNGKARWEMIVDQFGMLFGEHIHYHVKQREKVIELTSKYTK